MYIEFKLPQGAGGLAAGYYSMNIKRQIDAWAAQHNVQVDSYNGASYRLCFKFGRPVDYTLFALYWQPTSEFNTYRLVNDDLSIASSTTTEITQQHP